MIKIIDNFIPVSYQEHIKQLVRSNEFGWYYTHDITDPTKVINNSPGFRHVFVAENGTVCSPHWNFFAPLVHYGCEQAGIQTSSVLRARSFLQLPLNQDFLPKKLDDLHIDTHIDHLVILYYVFDSDGDTLISSKYKENGVLETGCSIEDHDLVQRITPKQGRVVLFDGSMYHTAEQPKNNVRCIINIDVMTIKGLHV